MGVVAWGAFLNNNEKGYWARRLHDCVVGLGVRYLIKLRI